MAGSSSTTRMRRLGMCGPLLEPEAALLGVATDGADDSPIQRVGAALALHAGRDEPAARRGELVDLLLQPRTLLLLALDELLALGGSLTAKCRRQVRLGDLAPVELAVAPGV